MKTDPFHPDTLNFIEMLVLISDYLNPVDVEGQFFHLVDELFSFDRVALFFLRHDKGVLQGKLARGFERQHLEQSLILLREQPLSKLLAGGLPYCSKEGGHHGKLGRMEKLGLRNFVFIPIVRRKNIRCWELNNCADDGCPAHGKSWMRCWHISGTKCQGHGAFSLGAANGCTGCPVFASFETMEGMLLVDNSLSGKPIREEMITALFVISQMAAVAISNSNQFQKTLTAAIRDELTGLYNRRYFNERLRDEIERSDRYGGAVSLISFDIDNFKLVNDTYGHQVGDRALAWLGGFLRERMRKSDIIARYGGEEFMILLLNTSKIQAGETAEELRRHIAETEITQNGVRLSFTVSFGVAALGEDGSSIEDLLGKADKALYKAKLSGRNKVCLA